MIRLDDKYVIDADTYGFVLGIPTEVSLTDKKTGEVRTVVQMKTPTYHATIHEAMSGYFRLRQRELISKGEFTILEAAKLLKEQAKEFEEIAKKYSCMVVPVPNRDTKK